MLTLYNTGLLSNHVLFFLLHSQIQLIRNFGRAIFSAKPYIARKGGGGGDVGGGDGQ